MADKQIWVLATDGTLIQAKYHDNLDGTHSLTAYDATPPTSLPLPAGAATEATLQGVTTKAGGPSWRVVRFTAGAAAAEVLPARATRRFAMLITQDAANDFDIGPDNTLTNANGYTVQHSTASFPAFPMMLYTTGSIYAIRHALANAAGQLIEVWD